MFFSPQFHRWLSSFKSQVFKMTELSSFFNERQREAFRCGWDICDVVWKLFVIKENRINWNVRTKLYFHNWSLPWKWVTLSDIHSLQDSHLSRSHKCSVECFCAMRVWRTVLRSVAPSFSHTRSLWLVSYFLSSISQHISWASFGFELFLAQSSLDLAEDIARESPVRQIRRNI